MHPYFFCFALVLSRSCFDTLEGHEATVWAISFDSTGDRLGKNFLNQLICQIIFIFGSKYNSGPFYNVPLCLKMLVVLASCSDDQTLRIWQCYKPGNQEGKLIEIHSSFSSRVDHVIHTNLTIEYYHQLYLLG